MRKKRSDYCTVVLSDELGEELMRSIGRGRMEEHALRAVENETDVEREEKEENGVGLDDSDESCSDDDEETLHEYRFMSEPVMLHDLCGDDDSAKLKLVPTLAKVVDLDQLNRPSQAPPVAKPRKLRPPKYEQLALTQGEETATAEKKTCDKPTYYIKVIPAEINLRKAWSGRMRAKLTLGFGGGGQDETAKSDKHWYKDSDQNRRYHDEQLSFYRSELKAALTEACGDDDDVEAEVKPRGERLKSHLMRFFRNQNLKYGAQRDSTIKAQLEQFRSLQRIAYHNARLEAMMRDRENDYDNGNSQKRSEGKKDDGKKKNKKKKKRPSMDQEEFYLMVQRLVYETELEEAVCDLMYNHDADEEDNRSRERRIRRKIKRFINIQKETFDEEDEERQKRQRTKLRQLRNVARHNAGLVMRRFGDAHHVTGKEVVVAIEKHRYRCVYDDQLGKLRQTRAKDRRLVAAARKARRRGSDHDSGNETGSF